MTREEEGRRERAIRGISRMLQKNPFTFEFKVKKKPTGIHIVYEVTQEEMDAMMAK